MEQRYATSPDQIPGMSTEELRNRYLVENLFVPGKIKAVYSHQDRIVMAGISPTSTSLNLPGYKEIRSDEFFEHREGGVVNIGGIGTVTVDGQTYEMAHAGCLYIGRGAHQVAFTSTNTQEPAKFYLFSAPAHTAYPTTYVAPGEGNALELGDQVTSNRRTLNQYIYGGGIQSCQILMGVTQLHPGSMWNTMPAHTHDRRMESYLYFDVPSEARIIHLMGDPKETRHLVIGNEQGAISPSWSIHSGAGTEAYAFIWAMAGENQAFDDMDSFPISEMR